MSQTDPSDNALVQYEEQLRRELAGLRDNVEAPSSNKISTKGKLFTVPGGGSSPGPLRVIVLDFIALNQYWTGAYNPNQRSPADCQAINKVLKELAPSPELSPKMQAKSCDGCPKNAWGSGQNGKGKACKNERKLLVIPPDFSANVQPMTLIVSPTGIKHWDKYVRDLASDHGVMPVQMITDISFDANQAYPTLLFSSPKDISPKHARLGEAMHMRAKYAEMLAKIPAEAEAA